MLAALPALAAGSALAARWGAEAHSGRMPRPILAPRWTLAWAPTWVAQLPAGEPEAPAGAAAHRGLAVSMVEIRHGMRRWMCPCSPTAVCPTCLGLM